jgi:hypothetical protein
MALNRLQQMFVLEYLSDPQRNAKAAYLRAGYSANNAAGQAAALLGKQEIKDAIEYELQRHLRKLQVNAEMVISGIVESIDSAKRAGQGAWQIQAIQRGYELLGRYLGIFTERVEVGLDDKIMEQLALGRARAGLLPKEEEDANDAVEEPNPDNEPIN